MRDILGKTFLGVAIVLCGVALFSLHFITAIKIPYPWLIDIGSAMFLLFGIFLLIRARIAHSEALADSSPETTAVVQKGPSLIERQQQMGQEWDDTTTKRDKLKMLKMASAAEEG